MRSSTHEQQARKKIQPQRRQKRQDDLPEDLILEESSKGDRPRVRDLFDAFKGQEERCELSQRQTEHIFSFVASRPWHFHVQHMHGTAYELN